MVAARLFFPSHAWLRLCLRLVSEFVRLFADTTNQIRKVAVCPITSGRIILVLLTIRLLTIRRDHLYRSQAADPGRCNRCE